MIGGLGDWAVGRLGDIDLGFGIDNQAFQPRGWKPSLIPPNFFNSRFANCKLIEYLCANLILIL